MKKLLIRAFAALVVSVAVSLVTLTALYYVPNPGPSAPRVLVSVDRTLWNAVGLNQLTYIRALRQAGLRTEIVDYESPQHDVRALLAEVHGLVLTGGGDVAAKRYGGDPAVTLGVNPARDEFEFFLLQQLGERDAPVLGLCRGAQLLNVHRGGTLGDLRSEADRYRRHRNILKGHSIELTPGSQLSRIYDSTGLERITTWHGQYVDEAGEGVTITAFAPDGTPEGFEVPDASFVVGVQWHAEMPPWDRRQDALFAAFASAVTDWAESGGDGGH